MPFRLLAAAAMLLSASLAAHADTFNYSFTATQRDVSASVSFDEPAILTSITRIFAADFVSSSTTFSGSSPFSGSSIESVLLIPLFAENCTGVQSSCIDLTFSNLSLIGVGAFFPNTNLTSVGVYTDDTGITATLTITDLTVPTAVTPEPSSIALLGTGLLGVVGVVRKRFA